jgi:hypothetical protein
LEYRVNENSEENLEEELHGRGVGWMGLAIELGGEVKDERRAFTFSDFKYFWALCHFSNQKILDSNFLSPNRFQIVLKFTGEIRDSPYLIYNAPQFI